MTLSDLVKNVIRDVPDFPVKGILFKDITPLLADYNLCNKIANELANEWSGNQVDGVAGIESRGFIFGMLIAQLLKVPFIPIRKAGKLPYETIQFKYDLEYGSATIEMHTDAVKPNTNILIHDDLLATGGTAAAAAQLIKQAGGKVAGYSFLIELAFLKGRQVLSKNEVKSLVIYS
jgi:adenine phosphoribosyltransferase